MRDLKGIRLLLVTVITGILQTVCGENLIINPSGQTQNQPAGKGFGLTCQGAANNVELFSEMKWTGPKGELLEGSSGPIEVSKSGSTLVLMFKSPSAEDSGMYNCSGMYDSTIPLNAGVMIVFYQDITWEDCLTEQALVDGSDGKIDCRVSANPPATVTWTKDNQPLSDRYIIETDGIKVLEVTEEDKGNFFVRAMVPQTGKFQGRVISVVVHVPPDIIGLEKQVEATEGNEAILHCQASGFPRPVYSWFDPEQNDLSHVEGHIVDSDTGTLTMLSVKREDHGSYTCMARNPAGEAKKSLDLTVIVKPVISKFSNITTIENKEAVFECHAEGDPLPEMSIRKDGHDRPFTEDDDRIVLNKRMETDKSILTLTIQRTIRSDDGLYYCAAENKAALVERVGHLTVEFGPVMSSTPSTSVKTWKGNQVNLTCIAEAIPNATISWSFLGQEIRENAMYSIYGRSSYSNLLVKPPKEDQGQSENVYGTYKCEANNDHGSQYINIDLQEARTPSVVLQTTPEKKTATTITFKFHGPKDDGGLPIRAFVVKFHEETQPYDKAMIREWSEGAVYVLKDLKPRTVYRLRFAARNDVGLGEWSEELHILMPEEAAPESPKFIIPGGNVSTYPDRFEIRWTEPLDNGKQIEFFELRYYEVEMKDSKWRGVGETVVKNVKDYENGPLYEMQNLKPNTYYKVEVRAQNKIGFSQVATMVFQTAADPSKVTLFETPNSPPGVDSNGGYASPHESEGSPLSTSAIAAIIIALVFIILIIVDVTCYVKYQWGLLYVLRNRVCAKPMAGDKAKEAAVEDCKGGANDDAANNGDIKAETIGDVTSEKGMDNFEKKSKTEVDNPAFDKEKEPLVLHEELKKSNDVEVVAEDAPMIESFGAKDTKPSDGNTDDVKNKSPRGSKSSIAKDSLV